MREYIRCLAGFVLTAVLVVLVFSPRTARSADFPALTIYAEILPPDQFENEQGIPSGFSVDVVREIQRRVGDTSPIRMAHWANAYTETLSKPNTILFTMVRTSEREKLFQWVGPLMEQRFILAVRADSRVTLNSLNDARRLRRIGTVKADYRHVYLAEQGFTNLDPVDYSDQNIRRLMAGRIDALASSDLTLPAMLAKAGVAPSKVRTGLVISVGHNYIAFSNRTSEVTVRQWRRALEAMFIDGTIERYRRIWYP
jgi:polar amino acid transport system substrate-binding protein